ncbi:MAG: cation-translocating P-type ATPase [Coriobacteriia bacterium]|nr:cation-translocating P-type ATPase [Coriobacteriia bacterium]
MDFFLLDAQVVMQDLKTSQAGLSNEEASRRLSEHGRNELEKAKPKSLALRVLAMLADPMVLILLVAAAVSLSISLIEGGTISEYAEAVIILTVVVINSVLGVYQESKAENAIDALQKMSASNARVRRNGAVVIIPAAEVVIGDIVLLEAGDAVPADLRLIETVSLRIEEAALTGESVPVEKAHQTLYGDESGRVPLGDRYNMAYVGSDIVYGRGEGVAIATGMDTEMGKIAGIIQSTEVGDTPLQIRLAQLSRVLTVLTLVICGVVFAVGLLREGEVHADVIISNFMLAISLAVAAIPEGLVAVVTIVLSIGVTNMAKRRAIIRRLSAVETLGCAQVICSDKTGTLTQNKMTVVESYGDHEILVQAMALCADSEIDPDGEIVGDPTENALISYAQANGYDIHDLQAANPRVGEAPFDSIRKMMSTVHQTESGIVSYTKGAPDEVLKVCNRILIDGHTLDLTDKLRQTIIDQNSEYADEALRVLAAAYRDWDALPQSFDFDTLENDLVFIGLEAMIDPVRPEVKEAIDQARSAGIVVVMITGDHQDTAVAIARQLGVIDNASQAITGRELDSLSDEEFAERVEDIFVYARVQPEHKVRIVLMWKQKGYVTAMTGDGVNDAPAIKSGDIGIGMGITGTDVTKNVADMVLADDNFATIVSAVEEGRIIYDNIRRTIQFLLGTNISEVLAVFFASLMGFVLFKPVHLLFINLITDSLPAIALGMEGAESDIMKRAPRSPNDSIFANGLAFDITFRGIVGAALCLAAYFIVDIWGGHEVAMTSAFFTMTLGEMFHSFNMRSRRQSLFKLKTQNVLLIASTGLALVLSLLIIYVPLFASWFALEPLTGAELAVSFGLSVLIIPIVELVKVIQRATGK